MTRSDASVPKSPQLSLVPRLLVSVVAGACRVPRLILVLTAILCVCSLYLALTRLEYQTSRDDLMSADKECQKRWRAFLKEFGRDDDIVVVVKDGQRHEKIAALESIAAHIQKHPQQLDRLFYKIDLRHVRDRALLYLPFDQLELLAEKLTSPKGLQPLLETPYGWQLFSFHFILNEATRRFKSYDDSEPIRAEDAQFFRELLALTRSAHATMQNPNAYRNPWSSLLPEKKSSSNGPSLELLSQPQYFFSDDGKLAFLLVRPLLQEKTFLGAHRQVTLLRGILNEVNREHPSLSMGITGLPVLEADEMAATQQDSKMASWLALAGVTVLYFLVFRTWRWPFFTVSTLVVGAIWTLGWLTLTVGHLNLLSATFAVMLIGMGDYGVLWVARYQQESESLRLSHPHPRDRVKAALRSTAIKVGPSILTASVTTGLAFFATTLADFQGMAELGWIAGCGVLLCAISCFTVLPVLLFLIDGSRKQITDGPVIIPMPQRPPEPTLKRSLGILTVGVLLSICLGIFSLRITYDQNLLNLQAKGLKSVHWEETLLRHTSAASWHALSYASTRKEALQLKARFEKVPEVSHVVEVASLLPGDAKEQRRKLLLLQTIQEQLRSLPPRGKPIPTLLKRESIPHDQIRAIEEHCSRWKGQKLFHDLGAALKRFRANVSELSGTESASRFKTFQRSMVRDLAEGLHQLRAMSSPKLIELSEIPESLRQRYVSPQGSWLLRVFGRDSLWEDRPLRQFVEAVQSVDSGATGKPFVTLEGLSTMKSSFQWAGFYSVVAIVLILLLDFRAWKPAFITLVPLALGAMMTLGLMTILGWGLNPANMIALPLLVGVGIDNGVHVVHDYFSCRHRGEAYRISRATCKGILVAGLTTMLGFGTLMLSHHRGLASMGLLLTVGVGCCMLSALILLPSLLHVWSLHRPAPNRRAEQVMRRAA